jgi:hypothetical protein
VLTKAWSWRATFFFLATFGGILLLLFAFFRDTFRPERSTSYQNALSNLRRRSTKKNQIDSASQPKQPLSPNTSNDVEKAKPAETPVASDVKLSLRDVNPIPQFIMVIKRKNNLITLVPSGAFPSLQLANSFRCPCGCRVPIRLKLFNNLYLRIHTRQGPL